MPQVIIQYNADSDPETGSMYSDYETKPDALKAQSSKTPGSTTDLPDDTLILASPVSLADKLWCTRFSSRASAPSNLTVHTTVEFNVQDVHPIQWSPAPFANLVPPGIHNDLLQSLVEAHNTHPGFGDFVQGKGRGLVINLFGPPGIGKTLSAEATSEHLRRPLYILGGDLCKRGCGRS